MRWGGRTHDALVCLRSLDDAALCLLVEAAIAELDARQGDPDLEPDDEDDCASGDDQGTCRARPALVRAVPTTLLPRAGAGGVIEVRIQEAATRAASFFPSATCTVAPMSNHKTISAADFRGLFEASLRGDPVPSEVTCWNVWVRSQLAPPTVDWSAGAIEQGTEPHRAMVQFVRALDHVRANLEAQKEACEATLANIPAPALRAGQPNALTAIDAEIEQVRKLKHDVLAAQDLLLPRRAFSDSWHRNATHLHSLFQYAMLHTVPGKNFNATENGPVLRFVCAGLDALGWNYKNRDAVLKHLKRHPGRGTDLDH